MAYVLNKDKVLRVLRTHSEEQIEKIFVKDSLWYLCALAYNGHIDILRTANIHSRTILLQFAVLGNQLLIVDFLLPKGYSVPGIVWEILSKHIRPEILDYLFSRNLFPVIIHSFVIKEYTKALRTFCIKKKQTKTVVNTAIISDNLEIVMGMKDLITVYERELYLRSCGYPIVTVHDKFVRFFKNL